jgi:predicted heme/steroid binding protein
MSNQKAYERIFFPLYDTITIGGLIIVKKLIKGIFLLLILLTIYACSTTTTIDFELIELTIEELATYDGLEGRKAYIAVNGVIYDVTNSSRWPGGNHNGYQAGQDLTTEILGISPHGISVLNGIPIVGSLVESLPDTEIDEELPEEENELVQGLQLTLEELAYYDGLEGRKAYIAVNGVIYDVSNSSRWPGGNHNGYQAGQDLTTQILGVSPHGIRVLDGIPIVGTIIE